MTTTLPLYTTAFTRHPLLKNSQIGSHIQQNQPSSILSVLTQTMSSQCPSRSVSGAAEKFTVQPRCPHTKKPLLHYFFSSLSLPPASSISFLRYRSPRRHIFLHPSLLLRRIHSVTTAVILLQSPLNQPDSYFPCISCTITIRANPPPKAYRSAALHQWRRLD
jgi:hypothetical protein